MIASPFSPPSGRCQNYVEVLISGAGDNMGKAFINSFVVTVPATIIPILIAAFAAYAFTFMESGPRHRVHHHRRPARRAQPGGAGPAAQALRRLGLTGTFPAIWLAHIGFGMPLAIYILRNYMSTLPTAIIESAKIDGASHFTTFWRLIMPMSVPALASFAIFQFLWVWNDLLVALLFLGPGDNTAADRRPPGCSASRVRAGSCLPPGRSSPSSSR